MGGGLAVPPHIQKIEADLKKEWANKEREVKEMLKESAAVKPEAKGTKRKADQVSTSTSVNVNVSVSVSSTGVIEVQAANLATKRAKVAPKITAKEKKVTPAANPPVPAAVPKRTKQPARRTVHQLIMAKDGKPSTAKPKAAPTVLKEKKTTAPKLTEKKTAPVKSTTGAAKPAAKAKGNTKTAAQQVAPSQDENGDAPPPYSEYDPSLSSVWRGPVQPTSPSSPRRRIGLLNGRYDLCCKHVEANFPQYRDRLSLIGTLDGNTLWLKFNLGVATGMMKVTRPYEVNTEDAMTIFWRGDAMPRWTDEYELHNIDTEDSAGSFNGLFFNGEGHIHGFIRYGSEEDDNEVDLKFDAYRRPDQSMTSEISPTQARQIWASLEGRWDSYSRDSASYDEY